MTSASPLTGMRHDTHDSWLTFNWHETDGAHDSWLATVEAVVGPKELLTAAALRQKLGVLQHRMTAVLLNLHSNRQ